ncbi:ribonuclease J [Anaerobium acetethylicum]|uniref:Ribonuclease J n=1 Tax=Anaerobium acetethylicum TaxID=1619234 RepID=A0A1D3TSC4_9FIRM|nr:ribonuclease J [Anaerobium acetethylicum]SCP96705.1 ribonuclease J [Anaerobium acetethylicum]
MNTNEDTNIEESINKEIQIEKPQVIEASGDQTKSDKEESDKPAARKPRPRKPRNKSDKPVADPAAAEKANAEKPKADKPKTDKPKANKPAPQKAKTDAAKAAALPGSEAVTETAPKAQSKSGTKAAKVKSDKLRIIPLGGLDKIGMNITAIEYEDSIIIVDCGISFPDEDMLGIDLVIPDISYLKNNLSKVKGFVITHGHEDHIGALPYVLRDINVPIYATGLTVGLIDHKLKEHGLLTKTKRKVVKHGQSINLGAFRIEFIKTNHSIADASALAIYSPAGILVHTGDFKIDYTPLFGDSIDIQRFAEIGKKGVLALMCDSTNASRPGFTPSEIKLSKTFENLFTEHNMQRMIVATFASNVDRVQLIINTAHKFGRKVVLQGRSMVNVIAIASELGYITIPDNTMIDIKQVKNYPDEKLVFITTGSQGESMAALSRMADGSHKDVRIKPGDAIIFSSTPIPGNEKAVSKVVNELTMKGAKIIFQDTHVSGHACAEEIKLIYSLLKPKYSIPVHGEYRHLAAQAALANELGISHENTFLLKSGDVLELSKEKGRVIDKVQSGEIYVDGLGVGDVGNIVLRDRQSLAENGIIIVVLTLEKGTNHILAGPDIVSRGFIYVRESEVLMKEMRNVINNALDKCQTRNVTEWGKLKNEVRDDLNDFLWKKIRRSPVILPIIMES